MAKHNYGYEKRQKELKKQRKQEEKRQRRLERTSASPEDVKTDETASPGTQTDE
ncbi:MAG: hypothetical protein ACREMZ_03395 [Gemmatimonadales bacterium]